MKISLYTITLSGGYYAGPAVPLLEIFPKAKGRVAQFASRAGQPSGVPRAACPPVLRTIAEEHWRASRQWHTAVADPMSIGQQALAPEAIAKRP